MNNLKLGEPYWAEPMADLLRMFQAFRNPAVLDEPSGAAMKVDITENDDAYLVKAELPGIDKNDIDVQIDGKTISINAKVNRSTTLNEGERVIRRERYSGSFSRTLSLACEIEHNMSTAHYQDGVLSLTLPKKARVEKRLPID